MPKVPDEDLTSDEESDVGDINHGDDIPADTEAKQQLNGELHDDVKQANDEDDEDDEDDEAENGNKAGTEDSDDEAEGEVYVVEAIRGHEFRRKQLLYAIKWQGYPESQNTLEPEDNLLPDARTILAAYHKKIGGPPTALKKSKSKQSLRRQSSTEEAPEPKRRRRNNAAPAAAAEEEVSTWLPNKDNWESEVVKIDTIERTESGGLMAFVLFKNGKRTRVSNEQIYKHCPRPMLKFYEDHLKFN
ncbi:hypothetical protein, variant [Exophiala sideris]|uniref:Chromo domain-containing protein n=1 Tax=Exophiala sideris TaxID=1016849 RepID=A0A0D1VV65_9EURO|nr:hypothetical protein, variant [Exophiala sideris]